MNSPVKEKHKIFTNNPTSKEFGLNNSISPSTQNYLKSLYTSLETLKAKETELLILQEYNSKRKPSSEDEKIEIKVHNKRFLDQLKVVKHNRYYYNHQITLIMKSESKSESTWENKTKNL